MSGLWLTDADDAMRQLYADLAPNELLLTPDELAERLDAGDRPSAVVIDDGSLLRLAPDLRGVLLDLPRVAVCTGAPAEISELVGRLDRVRILSKPFSLADFEKAVGWLLDRSLRP